MNRLPWSVFQASDRDTNNNNNIGNKQTQNSSLTASQAKSWQLKLTSEYNNKFTDYLFNTLRKSIEQAAKHVQSYFDYPNELFHELHSHIANCKKYANFYLSNPISNDILIKLQHLIQITDQQQQTSLLSSTNLMLSNTARHSPIVIVGSEGSGKTTILSKVFLECENWFEKGLSFF